MLLLEDPRGQRLHRVVVFHRHRALEQDWTAVQLPGDEVDGRAADLHAVVERLALRVHAGKGRQQRWVDVQDGVGERLEQRRADEPHETRKANEDGTARPQFLDEPPIVVVARGELAMVDDEGFDSGLGGAREAGRRRLVRDHDRNPRAKLTVGDGVDQRLQVAAAARDENTEPPRRHGRHASSGLPV